MKVLAVDDSRTIREMVKLALANSPFKPTVADDGMHGLEVLETFQPDAIITDINMPRLDGFGFIEAVRQKEHLRGVPILVLTTESAQELKLKARKAGATGWIVKPFDPKKLVSALRMVTGG